MGLMPSAQNQAALYVVKPCSREGWCAGSATGPGTSTMSMNGCGMTEVKTGSAAAAATGTPVGTGTSQQQRPPDIDLLTCLVTAGDILY